MAHEPFEYLERAIRERRCILFVGAGLSIPAGYDSWGKLVDFLVDEARKRPYAPTGGIKKYEKERDYFTLAEFARSTLGDSAYEQHMKDRLGKQVALTRAHEIVADTDYRGIITTNYDKLLETAFTLRRQWAKTPITPGAVSSLAKALFDREVFIFKLHGDIDTPKSIVLTGRDYDQLMLQSPHVRIFMQATFLSHVVLFVGYSLRDPDFQLVLRELTLVFGNSIPEHYALIADADAFTAEYLRTRMNIQVIPYKSKDNHAELIPLLERFQKLAPYPAPGAG
jgi:hypothetical protein